MQAEYFTRSGFTIYWAMIFASGAVTLMQYLVYGELTGIPDFGWVIRDTRMSPFMLIVICGIVLASLNAWGGAARPKGPGTGKFLLGDVLGSLAVASPLVLIAIPRFVSGTLPGDAIEVMIVVLVVVLADIPNWVLPQLRPLPTTTTPRFPMPTGTIAAAPANVAPGGTTTLTWSSANATTAEIVGVGTVLANGSLAVTPPATRTYTLRVSGPGGVATQDVTVTVA